MNELRQYFQNKKFILLMGLFLFTIFLNFLSSELIQQYFPDREPAKDLLFTLTPYIGWTQYLTDIANVFSVFILVFYISKGRISKLPFVIFAFVIAEFLRSIIII